MDQFDSVDQFLRQAVAAKDGKRQAIASSISPGLQDHGTVGIPPKLAATIEAMLQKHGDETYRQIAVLSWQMV